MISFFTLYRFLFSFVKIDKIGEQTNDILFNSLDFVALLHVKV